MSAALRTTSLLRNLTGALRRRRDVAFLSAALLLLIIALFRPTAPVQRDIHTYLLVVDITQSMNTEDMRIAGKKTSRIAYTRRLLHDAIASMPCGTRVGVALFAGVVVSTIFHPVEVCASFDAIQDTVEHIEWRQAWHGNSRLGFGMLSASAALKALPEPARVVFFTDGEEAPLLHAFNRADLSNWQGGSGWLLVGIGGDKPTPVPKMDENNKIIGYWSENTYQLEPGIAQVSDETRGRRDDSVATQDYERYLSVLDEKYLQTLAKEIKARYIRGNSSPTVIAALKEQAPARRGWAPMEVSWLLAALAALLLLAAYVPPHPQHLIRALWLRRHRQH
ncbi:MAG: vWA domain-containing protein [Methylophilaceae bacterium]|nr:vWA domain-containing protein [Methylophilaceae bacterium]